MVVKLSTGLLFLWFSFLYDHPFLFFLLQALGDIVESIAGAILIDTKLNLDEVWRIYEPLLSPIVTPDKLELPGPRKLNELCDSLGYFIKEKCIQKGDMVHVELKLQLKDDLLVGEGYERSRKAAKGEAACHLLKELEVCWCFSKWLHVVSLATIILVLLVFPRTDAS